MIPKTTPWYHARKVLVDYLSRYSAKLMNFERVGSHGGRASIRGPNGGYFMVEASVPKLLTDRRAIDGALAFLLVWEADWQLVGGASALDHGELQRVSRDAEGA